MGESQNGALSSSAPDQRDSKRETVLSNLETARRTEAISLCSEVNEIVEVERLDSMSSILPNLLSNDITVRLRVV